MASAGILSAAAGALSAGAQFLSAAFGRAPSPPRQERRSPTPPPRPASLRVQEPTPPPSPTDGADGPLTPHAAEVVSQLRGEVKLGRTRDEGLRRSCWTGCPPFARAECWRLLCGCVGADRGRRELRRKRAAYLDAVRRYYDPGPTHREDEAILRQIRLDLPRTLPTCSIFRCAEVMRRLERVLYVWAVRHPAVGYVQGINDVVAPFFAVFAAEYCPMEDLLGPDPGAALASAAVHLDAAESDTYYCATKLLEVVQDNYTFAQPGIQRSAAKLAAIIAKVDVPLHRHLQSEQVEFLPLAVRWMNCLLVRELPLSLVLRLWDTYLSEGDDFPSLHVYVCAVMLEHYSAELRSRDFTEVMMFAQALNSQRVHVRLLEEWISRAYVLQARFEHSNHLTAEM
eukprot:TRINITY_DN25790_c0_g1_i1.p1 TRINITY_DN25790_c0_g1~~TRINITY_DN25790_c0_g1_i1.p1  ORF type:complete len:416 (+),score=144.73 TRINITY_DN25790_c0_g1_i1:56-1249(+)